MRHVARAWWPGLVAAVCLIASTAGAQAPEKKLVLTPFGGVTRFDTEFNPDLKTAAYAGGRLTWRITPVIGLEAAGGYTPSSEDIPSGRDIPWQHASGNLFLVPLPEVRLAPFLSGGLGWERFGKDFTSSKDHLTFDAAAGLLCRLTDAVGLRLEARNVLWLPRKDWSAAHFNELVFGAGLSLGFGGRPKDSDGDGVPDKLDRCPGTTPGCKVDAHGCPLDSDGDGVCDGLDQCPATPKGAKVDAHGCPLDSDGDGVYDGLDQCPDTPKGCTVDAKGCPLDSDGDGVCDGLDKCPNTPQGAKVDKDGCPIEVSEKETELLDTGMIRLNDVNFETGKAVLQPEAGPVLDDVGRLLERWPELRIEIGGHTDNRGGAAYNQKLSEARAQAVLDYLTSHFSTLKPEQYTVHGYGLTKPLVPNTSDLNRARNRRVEFKVLNKDVLKREKERRRLLQQGETPGGNK